jgi:ubiquinone/menaquinone biosynthesis C-methylase UbiE/predicted RNA methylase
MFRREFVTSLHVSDPITFCINVEESILAELKSQFEGRNHKNTHVIKIDKILERSACVINLTGLDAAATINVKFSAMVDVISAKDLLYPFEITSKEPMTIGICKQDYNIFAVCMEIPGIANIKLKQTIPLIIEQSIHEYRAKNVGCIGKFLTYNNNDLPMYKIPKITQEDLNKVFENSIIKDLMTKISGLRSELKKMPTDIVDFFEKLYDPDMLDSKSESFDILDKKLPSIKSDDIILSRFGVRRTSNKVIIVQGESKSVQVIGTLEVAMLSYIYDIYNYTRLILNFVKTHGTKASVRENNAIWKLVKPNFTGGFEESSDTVSTTLDIIAGQATTEDNTRFSKNVIEAAEKYGSKFKWDAIRIVKNTPQYSLMPWQMNSQNKALKEITEGRQIKTIIDLTTHVGVDSINLAYEFPNAKLIGIDFDSDICRIYKCNLAMIVNKYEANCGNGVDFISTLERHEPKTSLIYLDPPWGGREYKDKDSVSLELIDLKGKSHNMFEIIKMIFNRCVSDLVILKTPNNYDMQNKLLQEPTWNCKKYEIKNEIARSNASGAIFRGNEIARSNASGAIFRGNEIARSNASGTSMSRENEMKPGEFGRTSYLLFAIEAKDFVPPSYKNGRQFQYVLANDELKSRLRKLLQKFNIEPNLKDFNDLTDIEIYQKLCSQIKESKQDNKRSFNFGKSRGIKRYKDIRDYFSNRSNRITSYMDVGAGDCEITADISHELKLKKSETFGIDYTGAPSKRAENNVTFHLVKPGDKLPIPDKKIDLITAFQSMHHFQDLQYKLEEMTRVASPDAILVIREHDLDDSGILRPLVDIEHLLYIICFENSGYDKAIEEYWAHYRTKNEWNKLLESLGWHLIDFHKQQNESPTNYYYAGYSRIKEDT